MAENSEPSWEPKEDETDSERSVRKMSRIGRKISNPIGALLSSSDEGDRPPSDKPDNLSAFGEGGNEGSYSSFSRGMRGTKLFEEGDWDRARSELFKDAEAWNEYVDAWNSEGKKSGLSSEEFLRDHIYGRMLKNRGFEDRHARDAALELAARGRRDPYDTSVEKSPWQEDLERSIRSEAMGRLRELGMQKGNRGQALMSLKYGLTNINEKMSGKIREARVEESRNAENALDGLLAHASKEGRAGAMASQQMAQQVALQQEQYAQQNKASLLSFFGTVLSSLVMAYAAFGSDERLKQKTGDTQGAAYDYLDKMETAEYDMPIRAIAGQPTRENGVMAQSLEKSELGKQAVGNAGGVRMIDTIQGLRSTMVAQKELHERLKQIEGRLGVNFSRGVG